MASSDSLGRLPLPFFNKTMTFLVMAMAQWKGQSKEFSGAPLHMQDHLRRQPRPLVSVFELVTKMDTLNRTTSNWTSSQFIWPVSMAWKRLFADMEIVS